VDGVKDPPRGTYVAVSFPLLAFTLAAAWFVHAGLDVQLPIIPVIGLLIATALSERILIQLGPRSWYSPSTSVIVAVGLLGGPLLGVAAGIATKTANRDQVWRQRCTEGGLAALQGFVAGLVGLIGWSGSGQAVAVAAGATLAAVIVNSAGRALTIIERRLTPFAAVWLRGMRIDVGDAVIAVPVIASLMLVVPQSSYLAVAVVGSILTALTFAHRLSKSAVAALAAEQVNARRDPLTGAPNRRAFEELLASEHARILRGDHAAGLFVVDIDRFKSINDRHGHAVGDQVLIACINRLSEGLRAIDVVARWGGEEITVLAPGIKTERDLEVFGERIRSLVGDTPLMTQRTALPVTVSVGGTLLDGAQPASEAIRQADQAMYEAKRRRDRSVTTMPPNRKLRLEASL
jgi:diguanylate cyclase (GGDEF)-like protein